MEVWKPCPGFEDVYAVSSLGRFKRVAPGASTYPGRIAVDGLNPKGYRAFHLCRGPVKRTGYIHRLVCEAFHGAPPSPQHQAAHRDDDKTNNRADNLYWATSMENGGRDRRKNGRIVQGSRVGRAKLKEADIHSIIALRAAGKLQRDIAEEFGVAKHTISRILAGKRWGHMGLAA